MATTETVTTPTTTAAPGTGRGVGLAIALSSAASFALSGSFGHALLDLGWSPTALVAAEVLGVGFKVNAPFPDGELQGDIAVVGWDELVAEPVTRLTLREPEMPPEDFLAAVHAVGLHGVTYAVGWSSWLDINPEGVTKASALELVRRKLGVDPALTVAVGDQRNDVEMLRWAARGVAMGNAHPEAMAAANEITASNTDDGVARVLERWWL